MERVGLVDYRMDDISHDGCLVSTAQIALGRTDLLFSNVEFDQFIPCSFFLFTTRFAWAEDRSHQFSSWVQAGFGQVCQ
jgi:hypothetical protein